MRDLAFVLEIALVSHEDDDDFFISVILNFCEPFTYCFVGRSARDIIDEEHTNGLPVVGVRDSPIPLLASCVPNLRSDQVILDLHVV